MIATPEDHRLAAALASEAAELLVELRARLTEEGAPPSLLRDQGDRRSNELILDRLAEARPDDAVLSEEAADDLGRLDARRVWIVDPLDGTREFSEPPRTDWAVHVALAIDGEAVVGAVSLPALSTTFHTAPGGLEHAALGPRGAACRVVVSRTRPPAVAAKVLDALDGELVEMGSAGAKAMAVVRGEADVYVHGGGQYEWDNCAPAAVVQAAGLHASRIDGSPLRYNNADPYLPDLLVCRSDLADEVLHVLAT